MLRPWLSWLLLPTAIPAFAEPTGDLAEKLRNAVREHDPAAQVAEPEHSPVWGLYLTYIDGVSGYVSADGRYFIVGDMLDLASRSNVTETQRQAKRRAWLQRVGPEEAIVFGPARPRHTIIVFTDVDCPYCRKLHSELDQLQAKGVAVHYMAFPRSGPGRKAWRTMAAVWCAKDRREALTRATRGECGEFIVQRRGRCQALCAWAAARHSWDADDRAERWHVARRLHAPGQVACGA